MPATIYGNTSFRVWASLTATKRFVLNDLCAVPSRRQKCEGLRQRIIKVAVSALEDSMDYRARVPADKATASAAAPSRAPYRPWLRFPQPSRSRKQLIAGGLPLLRRQRSLVQH